MDFEKYRIYQLLKQSLIEKTKKDDFMTILRNHLALHSTDYLTPYLSLWSRVDDFDPKQLFHNISSNKLAIRMRAFRRTVFVVHRANLEILIGSIMQFLEPFKLANIKYLIKNMGMKEGISEKIGLDIIKILKEKSPLSTRQIKKELSEKWEGDWIRSSITLLEFEAMIARVGQKYITDKTINWGLFEEYYPEVKRKEINLDNSLIAILSKYIQQFGPVCLDDFCWWLPAKKTTAKKLFYKLSDEIIELDFNSKKYYMKKDDFEVFSNFNPEAYELPIVNFLPYEDHYPKAYKHREWYISEETVTNLFKVGKMDWGQIRPSIWINGEIKSRWELDWVDKKKSEMKAEIVYLDKKIKQSTDIMNKINHLKTEVEIFANEKLIPIMRK